ncbi:MAG: DNA metabolism protein [Chitinophagaceae bacterium]|nr:MAG: DNA metabolism protein [Chitinophagaceae bacterium]
MTTLVYDGSFKGWLTAIFEVYEYKFRDPGIQSLVNYQEELLHQKHMVITDETKSARVWKGLSEKISKAAQRRLYHSFLSEEKNIENVMLQFVQYAMKSATNIEHDFGNSSVLKIQQQAKMVHREKHRMEAFVRFQLTGDQLFYAIIQPDFNVLPLIEKHFRERYADQRWLIYDTRRRYGIYYDLTDVTEVNIDFSEQPVVEGHSVYDEKEPVYQQLWQHYFDSINIKARKNTRLHIQHMPKRYWKYLTEKQV